MPITQPPPSGDTEDASVTDTTMKRRWVRFFVALFPLAALWALANPMLASPDETTHIVRAQGIARCDFTSPFITDGIPLDAVDCFRFKSEVTADCQDLTWGPDGLQQDSPTDNYPGFFHTLAAPPAVFVSGLAGTYAMRLWLAAIATGIFAWAAVLATRPRSSPWQLTGLAVALPPTALFTMATVNPSGLAAAFTALFVTGALALRTPHRGRPEVFLAVALGAAGLVLVRRDGLAWLALVVLVLVPLIPFRDLRASMSASFRRIAAISLAVLVAVALVVLAWAGPTIAQFLREGRAGGGTDAWEAARYIRFYLYQLVGTFGWLDSPIGEEAFLVAMIVAGFLVILGLVGTDRRLVVSTGCAATALVLSPVAVGLVTFPYLQGRYMFPIWVCALVVAGASAATSGLDRRLNRRLPPILLGVWLIVHVVGYVQNLRRYAVGRSGSWGFVFDAPWNPDALSNMAAVLLFVVAAGLCAALFGLQLRELNACSVTAHPDESATPLREVDVTCDERSTNPPPDSSTR